MNKLTTVKVRKQIVKNNVFKGYKEIDVAEGIAKEQLSKPEEKRHPAWKGVEYLKHAKEQSEAELLAQMEAEEKGKGGKK